MNYFLTQIEKDEISNIVRLRHILQILSRQGLASSIVYEKESNVDRLRGEVDYLLRLASEQALERALCR